jgi:AcrR family transcriptional regulator
MSDRDGSVTATAGIAGVVDGSEEAQAAGAALPRAARRESVPEDDATVDLSAATRERAKEKRLAERGDRILDALARLITRWGYGKTTVDDVAREAGVAKGTVYLHWPTKGAMLQALIEREEQQWNAVVFERMAADPRNGTISSTYRHALALAKESPLLRALLTQDHDALGEWTRSPQIRAREYRRMEAMHALIRGMRALGLMRTDIAVEVQAYLIAALTYGILTIEEYLPADLVPPFEDIADAFAVIVRRGFEPEMTEGEEAAALARGQAVIANAMASLADAQAMSSHEAHRPDPKHATGNGRVLEQTQDKEDNT